MKRDYNSRTFWRWVKWHRARMKPGAAAIRKWRGAIVSLVQHDYGISVSPWECFCQTVTFTDSFLAERAKR
jgi:hypothetical protein